jgi:hypothetical protein
LDIEALSWTALGLTLLTLPILVGRYLAHARAMPTSTRPLMDCQPCVLYIGLGQDGDQLLLTREAQAMRKNIEDADGSPRLKFRQEWGVEIHELPAIILAYRPAVLHFSGHGSSAGELMFGSRPVSADDLAALLHATRDCVGWASPGDGRSRRPASSQGLRSRSSHPSSAPSSASNFAPTSNATPSAFEISSIRA